MKIALINPKGTIFGHKLLFGDIWDESKVSMSTFRFLTCPNLGLLTVAALASDYFDEIKYIDENIDTIDFDEKFDIVALSAMTNQIKRAYEVAGEFRSRNIPVIIGGIHASILPDEAKKYVDSVLVGEAEGIWDELMKDFQNGKLKPIYSNDNKDIDLSVTPIPRYDLLNLKKHKIIPVQASRGCPHNCEFCSVSKLFGSKYRYKKVEQVVQEIEAVKKVWDRPYIYFTDDNITVNKKYTKELLNALIPLKIRWQGYSDIGIAEDDELLELLYKSGCTSLLFGLESLSTANLDSIEKWKAKQSEKYVQSVRKIQSHKIGVFGSFIVGLDNDDTSVFKDIRDFIVDNNLYGASISVQTPLPGTRLYSRLKEENRITSEDWDKYTVTDVVIKPSKMTVSELEKGFSWLWKEIYSEDVVRRRTSHFKNILLGAG
ncbi:MAG TPA: radical SAM protein [Clostridia bacterium]